VTYWIDVKIIEIDREKHEFIAVRIGNEKLTLEKG
jgi:hypothetical protein